MNEVCYKDNEYPDLNIMRCRAKPSVFKSLRLAFAPLHATLVKEKKSCIWHKHGDDYPCLDFCEKHSGLCDECQKNMFDVPVSQCNDCRLTWHQRCVPISPENITHPCHPTHPLQLLLDGPPNYSDGKCQLCQEKLRNFVYHCPLCDFSVHARCANNPPLLEVHAPKCHEHPLALMARDVSFTCNACGMYGERNPYVCLPCSLMFHLQCTSLPRVININRHDHRVSHSYSLVFGRWKCGICHLEINWRYGSYSCLICPNFVVHSKCATREDVWDGVELEGVPEDAMDITPFKVIEGVINHFSHEEHNLKLIVDAIDGDESVQCEACTHPIYSEKHYSCVECKFLLHEPCANLPLMKRHGLSTQPYYLSTPDRYEPRFYCGACKRLSTGFKYKDSNGKTLDVLCATISWYRDYDCHPHTLFLTTLHKDTCGACNKTTSPVLSCVECKFSLDFNCATLPKKIKHRCDDHFLSLRYGEKASGKYWCEVCESILDPLKWFYTCVECGAVCHIHCVLSDFFNLKSGIFFRDASDEVVMKIVPNDSSSRPICRRCHSRCTGAFVFKCSYNNWGYSCSYNCY